MNDDELALIEAPKTIKLSSRPRPFSDLSADYKVPVGKSLLEMLEITGVGLLSTLDAHVFVDDLLIPRGRWVDTYPQEGQIISVSVVPAGSGGGGGSTGKNVLRAVMMIAVVALSVYTGGVVAGPLGYGAFWGSVATSAVGVAGALAVNALVPPTIDDPKKREDEAYYSITGIRNQANPYGPVPVIFGKHLIYPPYAALPYTETIGKDSYLRMLFCVGYGEYELSEMKIGETALSLYTGCEFSVGFKDDILDLYPNSVYEDQLGGGVELLYSDPAPGADPDRWYTRTTQEDIDEITLDITFPQGLWKQFDSGNIRKTTVIIEAQYSVHGADSWTHFPEGGGAEDTGSPWTASGLLKHRWADGFRVSGLTPGQYDVRVRRSTRDLPFEDGSYPSGEDMVVDDTWWTALRSIKNSAPVTVDNVLLIALRIKASGQLNGIIDSFNLVAERKLSAWTGSAWGTAAVTRNPAWAYTEVLRGGANQRPVPDSKIYGDGLLDWAGNCTINDFNLDAVLDQKRTVFEVLRNIAAVGRATFGNTDNKYTVVQDTSQSTPRQHFSPRNSWDYKGSKTFSDIPHCLRMRFKNEEADYQDDEIAVYDDGYDENTATLFETMDILWVTNAEHIWKLGRYYLAVMRLRPELHTINVDVEHLVATRGDLVRHTNDVISVGLGQARIKQIGSLGSDLITNGDMELDSGWTATYLATSEQSVEHPQRGFFSWKCIATGSGQFIDSDTFSTTSGETYKYVLYIRPTASSTIQILFRNGDDSGWAESSVVSGLSLNVWNKITGEYVESATGSNAFMRINSQAADTFYADNVSCKQIINANMITMDDYIPMESGKTYAAQIRKNDITFLEPTITLDPGNQYEIELSSVAGVSVGDLIFFGESGSVSTDCILSRIHHGPDLTARLSLIDYNPAILTADSGTIPTYNPNITIRTDQSRIPPTPEILSVTVAMWPAIMTSLQAVQLTAIIDFKVDIGTEIDPDWFQAEYRETDAEGANLEWIKIPNLMFDARQFEATVEDGTSYDFRIRSVTKYGKTSDWETEEDYAIAYDPTTPNDITGFGVVIGGTVFESGDTDFEDGDVEFEDESGSVTWYGRDIVVAWNEPIDLWRVKEYKLEIYDSSSMTLLRTEYVRTGQVYEDYTFNENFEDTNGSPKGDLTLRIWAVSYTNDLSENYAQLDAEHVEPETITGLVGTSFRGGVVFNWDESNNRPAFEHFLYRIRIETDSWSSWTVRGSNHVSRVLSETEVASHGTNASIEIEVKSKDCFGQESAASSTSENAGGLNIQSTDIDDFAVQASHIFTEIPIIQNLTLTNNSNDGTPGSAPGYIHWTAHSLFYNGTEYSIAAGYTDDYYIYWKDLAATTYSTTDNHPGDNLSDWAPGEDFIIAINDSGTAQKAWNAIANQVVGSAYIMTAAINDVHVNTLSGSKISANSWIAIGGITYGTDGIQLQYNGGNPRFYAGDGANNYIKFGGTSVELGPETSFGINSSTFGNDGIQLQYNGGNPRAYIGDGSDNYFIFNGTNVEISSSQANAILIKNGADIKVESGGDIIIDDGGNISVAGGGDIVLTPSDTNPSKIIFNGADNIVIKAYASTSELVIGPVQDEECVLSLGESSYKFNVIRMYGTDQCLIDIDDGGNRGLLTLNPGGYSSLSYNDATNGWASVICGSDNDIVIDGLSLEPDSNGTTTLGTSSLCWSNVYAAAGVTSCSDVKYKEKTVRTPLGLNFINALVPVEFEFAKTGKRIMKQKGKFHGLIASEVEQALLDVGYNPDFFAGIEKTADKDGDIWYGLKYEQLIGPLIKAVQESNSEMIKAVQKLNSKIKVLEEEVNALKKK
jgi:hypothetical protein